MYKGSVLHYTVRKIFCRVGQKKCNECAVILGGVAQRFVALEGFLYYLSTLSRHCSSLNSTVAITVGDLLFDMYTEECVI